MTIKKIKVFFLFILSLSLFLYLTASKAEGQFDPTLKPTTWRCLETEKYSGSIKPDGNSDHRALLKGAGFPTNQPVYIVGCVQTNDDFKCTSGNNTYDQNLGFGQENYTKLNTSNESPFPYWFVVDGGAEKTLPDGRVEVVVRSATRDGTEHSFYGVTIGETILVSAERANTLQYGTFKFEPGTSTCKGVRWDPYGRVFDSQSLEPLPDAIVTIYTKQDQNKVKLILPGLPNPITTEADGAFNFLVEPGTYYLSALKPGYIFSEAPNLHPNYTKAYPPSAIYRADPQAGDPLTGGEIVELAGQAEHRDIPLDPGSNEPYRAKPTTISYGTIRIGSSMKIEGKVSHPLTKVSFVQNGNQLIETAADTWGFYQVFIETSDLAPGISIGVVYTKVDLTASPFSLLNKPLFAKVYAQDKEPDLIIEPIPRYIEGYAYDKAGNVLPSAEVRVKLKMSDAVVHATFADENGFFFILPENLPVVSFYLEFIKPNTTTPIKFTPSEFAAQNKEYLEGNNIDLMAAKVGDQSLLPPEQEVEQEAVSKVSPTSTQEEKAAQRSTILLIIILTVGFVAVGTALYIYFRKKQVGEFG